MSDEVNARFSPTYDCKKIFIAKRYNCRKTKQRVHEILPCDVSKKTKNKCKKFFHIAEQKFGMSKSTVLKTKIRHSNNTKKDVTRR